MRLWPRDVVEEQWTDGHRSDARIRATCNVTGRGETRQENGGGGIDVLVVVVEQAVVDPISLWPGERASDVVFGASPYWVFRLPLNLRISLNHSRTRISEAPCHVVMPVTYLVPTVFP